MAASSDLCARCGLDATDSILLCPDCIEGRDIDGSPTITRYCRAHCLETDHNHAAECEARNVRKQLYRAGEILQSVFFIWREIAFHRNIYRVQRFGDEICLWQRPGGESRGPFYAFPHHICHDNEEKKALLSWMACNNAPQMVFEMSKKLLGEDMISSIESVLLLPASGSYKVVDKSNPYDGTHEVLAIDANDGNSYIIDLTSAQLGLNSGIVPLGEYMRKCGTRVVGISKHENVLMQLIDMMRGFKNPDNNQIYATQCHMYRTLYRVVDIGERTMGMSLSELLQKDQNTYAAWKRYLEQEIRFALRKTFAKRAREGHPWISSASEYLDLKNGDGLDSLEFEPKGDTGIYRQWLKQEDGEGAARYGDNQPLSMARTDPWKFDFMGRPNFSLARPTLLFEKRTPRTWLSLIMGIFQR